MFNPNQSSFSTGSSVLELRLTQETVSGSNLIPTSLYTLKLQELHFLSSLILWFFAPNLFSGILLPGLYMQICIYNLELVLKEGTLFIYKWYIKMYSCSPFVDDSVIVKGNLPEMLHCSMKVHVKSVLLRKAWSCVISESSITYMELYSIYLCVLFFVKFAEALKWLYSTWCTIWTEKWSDTPSKGKPYASYHFIQQHLVSVLFYVVLQCSMNTLLQLWWRNKYKDLAFIIWLF